MGRLGTFVLLLSLFVLGQFGVCHAGSGWELLDSSDTAIHTFGGGDLLCKVFNAISMLIYGNEKTEISKTFHAILKIALTVGGFSCICICFLKEKFEPIIKCFFLPALGIISILLIPRTTVTIQDHLTQKVRDTNKPALITVANVPLFLGKVASLVSTVSYHFNRALEGVSHGTDDAMYNWTGHIYAAENIFQAKKCRIANRQLEDNFREFCRECVYRDVGIGLYSKDDLVHQKNLLKFLEEHTSNLRTVFYREGDGGHSSGSFIPCRDAMKKMNQIFSKQEGNAREIVIGEMGNDIFFLLGQKEKGEAALKNLIKQQIAIDVLKEEIPGTLSSFASKRAEILQKENQKILGALGANSIVAMRNFFEALIYTVFPLMIVVSLLSFGIKPLISWLQFVLWVNTWPPFYVVVKFLLNSIWDFRRKSAWGESVDLTIFTSEGLSDLYSSMESIAAIAMAFIPFLSWIILKGGVHQMVHMASSLMSPAQTAASTAAAEKTSGNYSFGNIGMDSLSGYNAQMFKQSYSGQLSAGSVNLDTGRESSTFVPESGGLYIRQSDSYLREGISRSEAFSSALQHSLSTSESSVTESSKAASSSISDSANKAVGLSESVSKAVQSGKTWNIQESSSFQEAYQHLSGLADEYGQAKGISKENAFREVLSGGIGAGFSWRAIGIKGEGQMSAQDGVSRSESDSIMEKAMQTESFQKHIQTIKNLSKGEVGSILNSEDARLHEDFTQSLNQTESSVEQYRAACSRQQSLSDLKSYSETDNLALNQKLDQRFVEYLGEKYHGDVGRISDTLDLPINHPGKRAAINEFVEEYLPKTMTADSPQVEESYRQDAVMIEGPSLERFDERVEGFKRENTPRSDDGFEKAEEGVNRYKNELEKLDLDYKAQMNQQKDRLGYDQDLETSSLVSRTEPEGEYKKRKGEAVQSFDKPLRVHSAESMFLPEKLSKVGSVLTSGCRFVGKTGQLGAEKVRNALFRIGGEQIEDEEERIALFGVFPKQAKAEEMAKEVSDERST